MSRIHEGPRWRREWTLRRLHKALSGQLQDEGGPPRGDTAGAGEAWSPDRRPARRRSEAGERSAHLERQQGSQGRRECGVTPRGRGSKATVWTLDFTLRTRGRGYTGEGVESGAGGAELSKGWRSRQEAGSSWPQLRLEPGEERRGA